MKDCRYLYAADPKSFRDLPYKDALEFKVACGKALLRFLAKDKKDEKRYIAVEKAIKFNEMLLEEIK